MIVKLTHLYKKFIISLEKLQEEFEECFSVAQTALDALAFQQPHDEFREKTAQMFLLVSKAHKDIITGSQRVLEGAIEKLTLEIGKIFCIEIIKMF